MQKENQHPNIALMAIFGCWFLMSSVFLEKTLLEYNQSANKYESITLATVTRVADSNAADEENPYLTVDHAVFEARNEDYMGWIDILNIVISYPVVRAEDYW